MARIVLSTMGSLGDLHPMIALGIKLKSRGHNIVLNTWAGYFEKIEELGFEFASLRPNLDPTDSELIRRTMDAAKGPEFVIKELMMGNIREMYADLSAATSGADLFLTGELIYPAASVAELKKIKWISTTLAPVSMFSAVDPSVFLQSPVFEWIRPLPVIFHQGMLALMRQMTRGWLGEYPAFRREIGLSPNHDPVFREKFSPLLHLVLFSKALGKPQSDWPSNSLQTGFCFYDESDSAKLKPELEAFLNAGPPPIIFTLGSAAVMDAGDFFDESAKAAKLLGRRAVLVYGRENEMPKGLDDDIVAFDFAPYSLIFPHAACVVHQGGVGTTAQVIRAGVPHLIMPFSHDQPDNAARCRRAGVAETINRASYDAESATEALNQILGDARYRKNAAALKQIVDSENGTKLACDAIEDILRK